MIIIGIPTQKNGEYLKTQNANKKQEEKEKRRESMQVIAKRCIVGKKEKTTTEKSKNKIETTYDKIRIKQIAFVGMATNSYAP